MELQRIISFVFFFICSFLLYANTGIALVHGTKDHREDAYGGYWKTDFIESLALALKNPANHYVAHCDFSQYMWHEDSAQCIADQLLEFIHEQKIDSLTVYTHSDGANVMRWILSHPSYNRSYFTLSKKIKQIIALAPSSGGTILADEVLNGGIFQTSVGWLLGYLSADAIKQQRIGDMLLYNQELLFGSLNRPSLSIPFKVVVGTDVAASPLSSASYCNGYLLNSGLKVTKLYLNSCADGFLNCSSQLEAGTLWFYDKDKTTGHKTLSHNQSRHSCFDLDQILISAIDAQGVLQ
ncbi:hypothetical protein [Legionella sp. km772]|uniref:hypothetical protein n=1 Tax=Legionella sp. km772 TaxID=2498111 RepID=UPI000F8F502C|nr:hypothetical protein [Legionella sp. km772]RUR07332.1 hypothetical protein ELY15_12265 [Legionella sp. km772]